MTLKSKIILVFVVFHLSCGPQIEFLSQTEVCTKYGVQIRSAVQQAIQKTPTNFIGQNDAFSVTGSFGNISISPGPVNVAGFNISSSNVTLNCDRPEALSGNVAITLAPQLKITFDYKGTVGGNSVAGKLDVTTNQPTTISMPFSLVVTQDIKPAISVAFQKSAGTVQLQNDFSYQSADAQVKNALTNAASQIGTSFGTAFTSLASRTVSETAINFIIDPDSDYQLIVDVTLPFGLGKAKYIVDMDPLQYCAPSIGSTPVTSIGDFGTRLGKLVACTANVVTRQKSIEPVSTGNCPGTLNDLNLCDKVSGKAKKYVPNDSCASPYGCDDICYYDATYHVSTIHGLGRLLFNENQIVISPFSPSADGSVVNFDVTVNATVASPSATASLYNRCPVLESFDGEVGLGDNVTITLVLKVTLFCSPGRAPLLDAVISSLKLSNFEVQIPSKFGADLLRLFSGQITGAAKDALEDPSNLVSTFNDLIGNKPDPSDSTGQRKLSIFEIRNPLGCPSWGPCDTIGGVALTGSCAPSIQLPDGKTYFAGPAECQQKLQCGAAQGFGCQIDPIYRTGQCLLAPTKPMFGPTSPGVGAYQSCKTQCPCPQSTTAEIFYGPNCSLKCSPTGVACEQDSDCCSGTCDDTVPEFTLCV